jgi:hypothetical protein
MIYPTPTRWSLQELEPSFLGWHKERTMKLFNPDNHTQSEEHKKIYAYCELSYTIVDVSAATLFVIGSFLFFSPATTYFVTWLFVVGSVLFGLRPTIKLYREFAYLRVGDYDDIAGK